MKRGGPIGESTKGWATDDSFASPKSAPASLPQANAGPSLNGHVTAAATKTTRSRARGTNLHISNTKNSQASCFERFYVQWVQKASNTSLLVLAVFLWYMLGVLSISTSKLLLRKQSSSHGFTHLIGNVPPLYLSLQQLGLGSCLLRLLLHYRALGSTGLQPWPSQSANSHSRLSHRHSQRSSSISSSFSRFHTPQTNLFLAGLYFCLGFLFTNLCFQHSSAAFVETIKAAEPITSAVIAVLWGIEWLGPSEMASLGCVVTGCLLSTIGRTEESGASITILESLKSCCMVMASNLCFSFRGLHQKLLQGSSTLSTKEVLDDLNLQFRMQQIGVLVLCVPVLLWDFPGIVSRLWTLSRTEGLLGSGVLVRYIQLSIVNGIAFTSYNLASTYILTRISVVHHAALNCIRRIFAVVVTSIAFGIPITWMGVLGITISFGGFLSYTHFKQERLRRPRPLSSLLPMASDSNKSNV